VSSTQHVIFFFDHPLALRLTRTFTMLWACLIFPSLPLDVFARAQSPDDAAHPFVVSSGGHYPRVVAANAAARETGIRTGQLISASLAFAPELKCRDRDADAEARALAQLATWALTFTPSAGLAPPNAIVAEIGGSLRLFSGLPQLVARLMEGTEALGYTARLGLAPTPGAALLFARASRIQPIFATAQLPELLAPLPLTLVDLDDALRTTLADAGVTTFGQAVALPRYGLARRGGTELVQTLDRALGRVADPRSPFVPPPHFASKLDLPSPVHDTEALGFGVNRLVQELATWLTARGLGVTRLKLTLAHESYLRQRGLPATGVSFALGAPARMPAHLSGVLRERLARVTLPAPVESIVLVSEETAPLLGHNLGLLPGDEAMAVLVPLVDRLRARLGEDAVVRVAPHAEHRPEQATHDVAVSAAGSVRPAAKRRATARPAKTLEPAVHTLPDAPRPLWLLAEPQPLAHLFEAKPWISSWKLRDGPERIESGWWDGTDVRRDYFVAENPQGELMWIYRDHRYGIDDGEWFLHGVFA
jgi:protein ImuB